MARIQITVWGSVPVLLSDAGIDSSHNELEHQSTNMKTIAPLFGLLALVSALPHPSECNIEANWCVTDVL